MVPSARLTSSAPHPANNNDEVSNLIPQHISAPSPPTPIARYSLPPSPALAAVGQKRTRNSLNVSPTAPTPTTTAVPPRPRRSWGRRSASWTPEEDARLVELVKKETSGPPSITTFKTWSRVASQLTNRTGKQCRERYLNQLKPGIRRDPWSPDEERILHDAHARIGNKWVAIAALLPGRTDNCVKNHWNSMLRKKQRREAALKAAVKEVNATLGPKANGHAILPHSMTPMSSPSIIPDLIDRASDADGSIRTGCATPSGLSSRFDMAMSSGVPSPFTASSPITPKRDAKLQISSLVSANTSDDEDPPWRNVAERITLPLPVAPQMAHLSSTCGQRVMGVQASASWMEPPQVSQLPQSHPSVSNLPEMNVGHSFAGTEDRGVCVTGGAVRRSERLLCAGAATEHSEEIIQRKGLTKVRRMSEGPGNPLAALAIAASSVPPSPLTPESRFSRTSRSRSASPERDWRRLHEQKQREMANQQHLANTRRGLHYSDEFDRQNRCEDENA